MKENFSPVLKRVSLRRNLRWDSEIRYVFIPHFVRFSHRARVRVNVVSRRTLYILRNLASLGLRENVCDYT